MSVYDDVLWRRAVIADSASLSDEVDVQGYDVVALQHPANTEGTAYTFQGAVDGLTFADVYDNDAGELSVTKSATLAQVILLGVPGNAAAGAEPAKVLAGLNAIKIRTGTSAAPTTQTGEVVIMVALRAVTSPGQG